jgi:hypothetical protein
MNLFNLASSPVVPGRRPAPATAGLATLKRFNPVVGLRFRRYRPGHVEKFKCEPPTGTISGHPGDDIRKHLLECVPACS